MAGKKGLRGQVGASFLAAEAGSSADCGGTSLLLFPDPVQSHASCNEGVAKPTFTAGGGPLESELRNSAEVPDAQIPGAIRAVCSEFQ